MRRILIGVLGLTGLSVALAQPIRFTHQVSVLNLTNCLAQPGAVRVPLQEGDVNLEIVDWATAPQPEPFVGEFTLDLKLATLVGCVFVYGAEAVQYEMAGVWKQIEPGPETGRLLQLLPIPAGDLVETLRVRVPAAPYQEGDRTVYRATLPFLSLLPLRILNVAPSATVAASSLAPGATPQSLVDGRVAPDRNFSTAARNDETSETSPEWLLLTWKEPQNIRAIGFLRGSEEAGFGRSVTEIYRGEGDPVAAAGAADGWEKVEGRATQPGIFRSHQLFVSPSNLDTRGVRIRSIGAVKQLSLGELMVVNELGYAPGPVTARALDEPRKEPSSGASPTKEKPKP